MGTSCFMWLHSEPFETHPHTPPHRRTYNPTGHTHDLSIARESRQMKTYKAAALRHSRVWYLGFKPFGSAGSNVWGFCPQPISCCAATQRESHPQTGPRGPPQKGPQKGAHELLCACIYNKITQAVIMQHVRPSALRDSCVERNVLKIVPRPQGEKVKQCA